MIFKKGQLVAILGCSQALESKYLDPINAACAKFNITTKLQLAAFIAQVGHESGRLATTVENLNYSAEGLVNTWPSRFTAATAPSYARNQQKIANKVYADRMGNGNEASGDGWKYRGRGLIQVTGKSNYDAYSQASGFNAVANPDALAEATHAAMSAGWFWNSKGLNPYADRSDFTAITKRINGGTNGQADRELLYKKALIVLSDGVPPKDDVVDKAPMPAPPDGAPTTPVSDQKTPGAQNSSIVEPRAATNGESKSKYPWNFVNASRSGHISEVDDTPGYERLNMTHRTGTYWEMDNTGTLTLKSILDFYQISKYDMYSYVGGSYTQQVKGQSYVQVGGDSVTKVDGTLYANAGKIQFNTGMVSASGEINAPNINSTIFGGMSGMAFGDLLAKEAMVAYDIKKGKAPMLGQSLGFKSAPGATESGSADDLMPNKLDKQSPSGTPWITNGISTAAGVVTVAAMAAGIADLFKKDTPSKELENAMKSAADDIDKAATQSSKETPVFVKHVSFAKPTLISQSTSIDKPDPSLYVNNLHTIVSSTGKGKLHMSNGVDWIPVGDATASDHDYTDEQIAIVIDKINQNEVSTTDKILAEAQERAAAILNEATLRQQALEEEARVRQQQITSGLLAEATQRQADVRAEAIIRQSGDESLSNRILELTASSSAEIAAAIAEERQARTTAIEAEAFLRTQLAAKVNQNTASISDEVITRSNETSALSTRITNYIASNDASIASFKTEINTKVDNQGNALSTRIDAQVAANAANAAAITSETTARTTADSALSTRIDTVSASTESNRVAIQTETTARTTADTALGTRIDTLTATVTGGLATGVNVLQNAGFMVSTVAANVPDFWTLFGLNGAASVPTLQNGPEGYKSLRIDYTAPTASTEYRNGIYSTIYSDVTIRKDIDYIYAVRVRAISDNMVGKTINMTDSSYHAGSEVYITSKVLTKDWQWVVLRMRWNSLYTSRQFYINTNRGENTLAGSYSFEIATPIVCEGSVFMGFNLGTDQRILVNTATITTEQTVRAAADSALSSRVDTVSSQTTNAQSSANAANAAAAAAQTAADNAKTAADAANALITNISSDNIISPNEKPDILREWQVMVAERLGVIASATSYSVSSTAFLAAYTAVSNFISPISTELNNIPGANITIVGSTMRTVFGNYYIEKQALLNVIADKSKTNTAAAAAAAAAAQTAADNAKISADASNAELANIASDNILSKGEKPAVLLQWQAIFAEVSIIRGQADSYGVSRTAYDTAYADLGDYLYSIPPTGTWSDLTTNSAINGVTFRSKWANYYTARTTLLDAVAAKSKTNTTAAATAAAAAQTAADNAKTAADTANAQIANIASDNILSKNEKPDVILSKQVIDQEKADILAKAAGVSISSVAYVNAYNALTTYLTSLGSSSTDWSNVAIDTVIVGTTFRTNFSSFYTARQALLNAIAEKAAILANNAQSTADSAAAAAVAAQASADASNAQIANIASDNILSRGEKPALLLEYQRVVGEQTDIVAKAALLSVSSTNYSVSLTNLTNYLTSLGSSSTDWSNFNIDTVVVGDTLRTYWRNYYNERQLLLNAIAAKAATLASWNGVSNRPMDVNNLVLTPNFEDNLLKTWTGSGAVVTTNGTKTTSFPNKYALSITNRDTMESNNFPVSPGEKFYTSAFFFTQIVNYPMSFGLAFMDSNGAILSLGAGSVCNAGIAAWVKVKGSIIAPANAISARTWVQIGGTSNLGQGWVCNMSITRAEPGATIGATWGVDVNGSSAVDQQITNAINAANAAQASADTANTELSNIASDNILSKSEKPPVILQWDTITGELANIRSQADAFTVSRTAYDTSYQDLQTYLSGIGPGGTTGWSNTAVDSVIVGSTFRSKWANYYTARTNILNAITTKAKALADQGIATNAASIVNEATARTNGDQANATAIQTVSTTVAGHTSTISQQQSSIQGVQANYGIKINNNGYVSGFGLLSEPVNGNIVSAFNILADKFAIQAPNLNGGTPVVPFSVDSTTTPPTISLNGLIRIGGASDGTGGKNLLYNSGPSPRSVDGYSIGYQSISPTQTPVIGLGFDVWRPTGAESVYYNFGGTPSGACDLTNSNKNKYYPVVGGTKYEFSVYLSVHRCNAASLIVFLDSSGNNVGEYTGNLVNGNGTIVGGGALSNWPRSSMIIAAPATAVKCYVGVRSYYNGQNQPYTFASMWYFGQTGVNQTNPSPYSPAGVTSIYGGMIETDTLSAISANIGLMRTATSGQRTEIDSNGIRVYDNNGAGVLRVRLGVW